jgi:hypothetical protein
MNQLLLNPVRLETPITNLKQLEDKLQNQFEFGNRDWLSIFRAVRNNQATRNEFSLEQNFLKLQDEYKLQNLKRQIKKIMPQNELPKLIETFPLNYPELEITPEESKEICNFIKLDTLGKNNPTTEQVIKYLLECIRRKTKVELIMSCCIGQTPEFRNNKVRYFAGQPIEPIDKFFTQTQANSLDKIYAMTQNSDLNFKVNIRLGDMDFWAVDKISDWCDDDNLEKVEAELLEIKTNLLEFIKAKYPDLDFEITNWSESYSSQEFEQSYQKAQSIQSQWLTPDFQRQCIRTYFKSWGYGKVQSELQLTDRQMLDFIINDIQKIAGQYRVEANKSAGIVIWSQGYGKPSWPLIISNFDKQGLPPSISLTPNN